MVNCQSNQQIADSLYISLSTVKSHINNLFRKLDVVDRKGALQVVRESKMFN
ncbi:transcriptional regulator MalT [compost metagenome]